MFESYFVMYAISSHIVKHLYKNDPRTIWMAVKLESRKKK